MVTKKAPLLVVVNALDSYNVCGVRSFRTYGCHYCNQDLKGGQRIVKNRCDKTATKNLTCSLIVNGPGFKFIPRIDTAGHSLAHARPTGKTRSWATS